MSSSIYTNVCLSYIKQELKFNLKKILVKKKAQTREIRESKPCPEVIKKSCSYQLIMKLIVLINVKMPTIVGILKFISMINTTFESLKARKVFALSAFYFYKQLEFHAQLS